MNVGKIDEIMKGYVENQEMSGAALIVRQGSNIVYQNRWGYSKVEEKTPIKEDSIYRMMSMSKCVTAVAVMICVERGWIELDKPLSYYIPEFLNMPVAADQRYVDDEANFNRIQFLLQDFNMDNVKYRKASREILIRDLLSHSSGLQQGLVGLLAYMTEQEEYATLHDWAVHYSSYVLDFDPGTKTGYSPVAGFDILGEVVSLVSGVSLEEFIQKEICTPLGMDDTTFFLNEEQKKRLVDVYKKENNQLINVTDTAEDMNGILRQKNSFEQGCGGLFSTVSDYANFGQMLLQEGSFNGIQILSKEIVKKMRTEASDLHLESEPGLVWGLGMKIRKQPEKTGSFATKGTYGWSGAFGTHFFISPVDELEAVFTMNRADIGGSGSFISNKVEELVFGIWGK